MKYYASYLQDGKVFQEVCNEVRVMELLACISNSVNAIFKEVEPLSDSRTIFTKYKPSGKYSVEIPLAVLVTERSRLRKKSLLVKVMRIL